MTSDDPKARPWFAEKRDFVADHRDEVANARDAAADQRDRIADAREAAADERDRDLDARGAAVGLPQDRTAEAERAALKSALDDARADREDRAAEREAAAGAREQADERRRAATPSTGLALAFAEIARHLYEGHRVEDVLERAVTTAVATISGAEQASVTVRENSHYFTVATTDRAATAVDNAQYEADEGPCIDALDNRVVHAPSFPDPRWPKLGKQPLEEDVHGVASFRLNAPGESSWTGSLNTYAGAPDAYDDEAIEIGLILAAHVSVAVRATRDRNAAEELRVSLQKALASRDVIGQAKGILMERLRVTPEEAFDLLRRSSQRLNVKLREVAQTLTETGEFADTEP